MSFCGLNALAVVSVVISGIGCLAPPMASRGFPLYPESRDRLATNQVAWLSTPPSTVVKTVDGREVLEGGGSGVFELLPGCRIVEITRRHVVMRRYGMPSDLGPKTFVFNMKPGYEYMIVADSFSTLNTPVYATEQAPSGARTRTIDPVDPAFASQACKGLGDGSAARG